MSSSYRHRSGAYLDRVIDGSADGDDPLINLLQQVQAPPRRRETRGFRAASSAFVWAPSVRPYLPLHHRTGLTSAAARLWHPKALVAGLTLVAAVTIAAASTGALPYQNSPTSIVSGAATHLTGDASVAVTATHPPTDQRRSTSRAPVAPVGPKPSSSSTVPPVVTPTPALASRVQWCHEWLDEPTPANPIAHFLIDLAGGVRAIDGYCTGLLNPAGAPVPSRAPRTFPHSPISPSATNSATSTPTG